MVATVNSRELKSSEDVAAVKASVSIHDVVRQYVPNLKKQGREFVGLSPFKAEKTPSFYVDPTKGVFKCFASDEGGDVIRFVQLVEGVGFKEALDHLKKIGGIASSEAVQSIANRYTQQKVYTKQEEERRKQNKIDYAANIWRRETRYLEQNKPAVLCYLQNRNIDISALLAVYGWSVPTTLRFARLPYSKADQVKRPTMVGEIRDFQGVFLGIHRTFLNADGSGKADLPITKKALGTVWGGIGWLHSPGDCEGDNINTVVLGEGYETTLSVMAALARRGEKVYGASALTLGNLAGAGVGQGQKHPAFKNRRLPSICPDLNRPGLLLPKGIKRLVLLQDADGKDPLSTGCLMRRAVGKFTRMGMKVSVAVPELGKDFNDMAGGEV